MESFNDFSDVVITGSAGALGSYIDFGIPTDRDTLDILDRNAVMDFMKKNKPRAIIHMAALTDTNSCEEDPSYAFQVNSVGTLNVAVAAESVGAIFVYVSTSRVFDGEKVDPYTEDEKPNPKTVYGKSKYIGELITSLVTTEHIIARGCWIFGGGPAHDNKFFGNVLRQLGSEKISALYDVHGSPTYAKDFIQCIRQLLEEGKRGVFHVSNAGTATRADIVQHILSCTGSKTRLDCVDRSFYKNGHLLPTNESMSSRKIALRSWEDALSEYIKDEWLIDVPV